MSGDSGARCEDLRLVTYSKLDKPGCGATLEAEAPEVSYTQPIGGVNMTDRIRWGVWQVDC